MKIPSNILDKVDKATAGLTHGIVTISCHIRDAKPKYKFVHEEWIVDSEEKSTGDDPKPKGKRLRGLPVEKR